MIEGHKARQYQDTVFRLYYNSLYKAVHCMTIASLLIRSNGTLRQGYRVWKRFAALYAIAKNMRL